MDNEETITEDVLYVPRYIRQESDMEYGSVVTHENYNAKLNLNTTQGDYNTEILNILFNGHWFNKRIRIPYVDAAIAEEHAYTDATVDALSETVSNLGHTVETLGTDLSGLNNTVLNIINGTQTVAKAVEAEKIRGIDTAGARKYYGTNSSSTPGFYNIPDSLYATPLEGTVDVDGIYFTPRADSVDETMLTAAVRAKLNEQSITSYNGLTDKPSINSVSLVGNLSLATLGIQPAGPYLTEVPNTYALKTDVTAALNDYSTTLDIANTYETISDHNASLSPIQNDITSLQNTRAVVGVNSAPSSPKNGDLWIQV